MRLSDRRIAASGQWLVLLFSLAAGGCLKPALHAEKLPDASAAILAHEIQNRAYARATSPAVQQCRAAHPDAAFWEAYRKLEALNVEVYEPYVSSLGGTMTASAYTRLRAWVSAKAFCYWTDSFVRLIRDASEEHAEKLKSLQAGGDTELQAFFAYVVAQEIAQVEALSLFADGKLEEAVETLEQFVTEYSDPLKRSLANLPRRP